MELDLTGIHKHAAEQGIDPGTLDDALAEALRLAIKAMRSPRAAIAPGWGKTWSPRKDMSKRPPRRR